MLLSLSAAQWNSPRGRSAVRSSAGSRRTTCPIEAGLRCTPNGTVSISNIAIPGARKGFDRGVPVPPTTRCSSRRKKIWFSVGTVEGNRASAPSPLAVAKRGTYVAPIVGAHRGISQIPHPDSLVSSIRNARSICRHPGLKPSNRTQPSRIRASSDCRIAQRTKKALHVHNHTPRSLF